MNENSTTISQVTSNPKDHKALPDSWIPKARGVTGASRTVNQTLADLTHENLIAMLQSDGTNEVLSTKQDLYKIEGLNQRITKGETDSSQIVIGSLYVTNLHGSVSVKKATEHVRQRALETKCSWEGVNLK